MKIKFQAGLQILYLSSGTRGRLNSSNYLVVCAYTDKFRECASIFSIVLGCGCLISLFSSLLIEEKKISSSLFSEQESSSGVFSTNNNVAGVENWIIRNAVSKYIDLTALRMKLFYSTRIFLGLFTSFKLSSLASIIFLRLFRA